MEKIRELNFHGPKLIREIRENYAPRKYSAIRYRQRSPAMQFWRLHITCVSTANYYQVIYICVMLRNAFIVLMTYVPERVHSKAHMLLHWGTRTWHNGQHAHVCLPCCSWITAYRNDNCSDVKITQNQPAA